MIVGVGIDIIEVARVRKAVEKNARFIEKIFTAKEADYCRGKKNMHQHLAARFAAKEAFFKALGRRISWTAVELVNLPSGKLHLTVHSSENLDFDGIHVSVSHLADYATAVVILEKKEK